MNLLLMFDFVFYFLQICSSDHAHYDHLEPDLLFFPAKRVPVCMGCYIHRARLPQGVLRTLPWFSVLNLQVCKYDPYNLDI